MYHAHLSTEALNLAEQATAVLISDKLRGLLDHDLRMQIDNLHADLMAAIEDRQQERTPSA
jgi:hypothetical protein